VEAAFTLCADRRSQLLTLDAWKVQGAHRHWAFSQSTSTCCCSRGWRILTRFAWRGKYVGSLSIRTLSCDYSFNQILGLFEFAAYLPRRRRSIGGRRLDVADPEATARIGLGWRILWPAFDKATFDTTGTDHGRADRVSPLSGFCCRGAELTGYVWVVDPVK